MSIPQQTAIGQLYSGSHAKVMTRFAQASTNGLRLDAQEHGKLFGRQAMPNRCID